MSTTSKDIEKLSTVKQAYLALEKTRSRLESLERARREGIAVVGLSCRFPGGATDPQSFWRLLAAGTDAITEVPAERWDINAFYDPDPDAPGKVASRCGGFLDQVDQFDAAFFGISPREAVSLDPQQRLLLELTHEAFEHAGLAPDHLGGSPTGVFVGLASGDYYCILTSRSPARIDAYVGTGVSPNAAAGRLSYVFGLRGPCVALDTACSSSLVAIHLACQALRNGECDMALAGGVSLILLPDLSITFSKAHMLCPDGRCKSFDARANGYVRGEGAGVIVLKRLSDALSHGDRILAVIRGSAVNQDGPSSGLTVPNGPAQQEVIRRALAIGPIEPGELDYIEAHGTGTALGDPIEMGALGAVFAGRREPLWVGSVKTNIGHLEGASGVAGLIKVVLAMQHEEIPPHLHFRTPSPKIPWNDLPVQIPVRPVPWPRGPRRRLAGISSFGFTGINAHVVVEEPPPLQADSRPRRSCQLLPLAARTPKALRQLAERWGAHLRENPALELHDACFTAATGRSHYEYRMAAVVEDIEEACAALDACAQGAEHPGLCLGEATPEQAAVGFLFSGQGPQYVGMGRELYETEPAFREAFQQCEEILREHLDRPLREVVFADDPAASPLDETAYTQPALFALEYALAQLWESWGVRPSIMIGHSVGEYTAACLAGVFSLEDALKLVAARARLMQDLPKNGCMAAVLAEENRVRAAVAGQEDAVSIAAVNSPRQVVISGLAEAVEGLLSGFEAAGVRTHRLHVSHAFHSPLVEPVLEPFRRTAETVRYAAPVRRLVSNRTGRVAGEEIARPDYWCEHARRTVLFRDGMATVLAGRVRALLEIGPQATLLDLARACRSDAPPSDTPSPRDIDFVTSLRRRRPECRTVLEGLAQLYAAGCPVDWQAFARGFAGRKIALPTYPFQRKRYWADAPEPAPALRPGGTTAAVHPLLGRPLHSAAASKLLQFESLLSAEEPGYLADHRIMGRTVLPATGYVEMALAAAALVEPGRPMTLRELALEQLLELPDGQARVVQVALQPQVTGGPEGIVYRFGLYSRSPESGGDELTPNWVLHASGHLAPAAEEDEPVEPLAAIQGRCAEEVSLQGFYQTLAEFGVQFGPSFQGLTGLWRGQGEALGRVELPGGLEKQPSAYQFHPVLLDACIQVAFDLVAPDRRENRQGRFGFLPIGLERMRVYRRPGRSLFSHARMRAEDDSEGWPRFTIDLDVFDADGSPVARLVGFQAREIDLSVLPARQAEGFSAAAAAVAGRQQAASSAAAPPRNIATELQGLSADGQRQLLLEFLDEEVGKVLRLDPDERPHRQRSLFEQGMDSLTAVELLYRINRGTGLNLAMQKLVDGPAIGPLAEQLLRHLQQPEAAAEESAPSAVVPSGATAPVSIWLPYHRLEPAAGLRLFCFPPPEGSAEVFAGWGDSLRPAVEVCAVEWPGAGTRAGEAALGSWPHLLETAAEALLDYFDRPFALLGCGSGSLAAFDLAELIRERFGLGPEHLFVEGAAASVLAGEPGGEALPAWADFARLPRSPLPCPITAFLAESEESLRRDEMLRWQDFTQGAFRLEVLPGTRTSYLASPEPLLQIVARELLHAAQR